MLNGFARARTTVPRVTLKNSRGSALPTRTSKKTSVPTAADWVELATRAASWPTPPYVSARSNTSGRWPRLSRDATHMAEGTTKRFWNCVARLRKPMSTLLISGWPYRGSEMSSPPFKLPMRSRLGFIWLLTQEQLYPFSLTHASSGFTETYPERKVLYCVAKVWVAVTSLTLNWQSPVTSPNICSEQGLHACSCRSLGCSRGGGRHGDSHAREPSSSRRLVGVPIYTRACAATEAYACRVVRTFPAAPSSACVSDCSETI